MRVTRGAVGRRAHGTSRVVAMAFLASACADAGAPSPGSPALGRVAAEVEARVWAFHAADTARDAQAVVDLLWPEYTMLVDGARLSYAEVVEGSRDFMAGLQTFHTVWSDVEVVPLSESLALASFTFEDSIVTVPGDLIRTRGPTTLVWEKRGDEWRMRFGDADHYPITSAPEGPG